MSTNLWRGQHFDLPISHNYFLIHRFITQVWSTDLSSWLTNIGSEVDILIGKLSNFEHLEPFVFLDPKFFFVIILKAHLTSEQWAVGC